MKIPRFTPRRATTARASSKQPWFGLNRLQLMERALPLAQPFIQQGAIYYLENQHDDHCPLSLGNSNATCRCTDGPSIDLLHVLEDLGQPNTRIPLVRDGRILQRWG